MTTYTIAAFVFVPKSKASPQVTQIAGMQLPGQQKCVDWMGSSVNVSGFLDEFLIGVRLFENEASLKAWQTEHPEDDIAFKYGAAKELAIATKIAPYKLG